MKRVMANDSFLVDEIASILAAEIDPDVLQLTYHLPGNIYETLHDHRSMLIVIDEGGSEHELIKMPALCGTDGPLLLMKASLNASDLQISQAFQRIAPRMEEVTKLVRDFSRIYLRRKSEERSTWAI